MGTMVLRAWVAAAVCVAAGVVAPASASAAPSWSLGANPGPPGPPALDLTAVTCPTPTTCLALGTSTASAPVKLIAERWNGTAWSFVPIASPSMPVGSVLVDVSCSAPSDCFAVGSQQPTRRPLMEHWNGTAWSIVAAPTSSSGVDVWLTGVSCPTPTFCLATGDSSEDGRTDSPYGARWNGSVWSPVTMPSPADPIDVSVDALSCPTTTTCFAVGHSESSPGPTTAVRTLVERWNGNAWSIMASPTPAGVQQVFVTDVSCPSPSSCFAVGHYPTASGTSHPFSLRGNGSTWSIVAFAAPPGGAGDAHNVSCPSSTSCFAVGRHDDPDSFGRSWIQRWNGTNWTTAAHPSAGAENGFTDVACSSSTDCFAIGVYTPLSLLSELALSQRWNGTAWSISPGPAGGSQSQLAAVSCPTTTFCLAVGYATNTNVTPLSKRWDGTSWTIVAVPTPAGSPNATLSGVSCTSPTFCFAVGVFFPDANSTKALTERWNGSAWSVVPSPNPANATQAKLVAVTCRTATDCTAVGSANTARVFVQRWNGSQWTITNLMTDATKHLFAVSCPTAASCIAVGSQSSGTFARHWDGTTWSTVATPTPSGSIFTELLGVSCTSPTNCNAVGFSETTDAGVTLIEHWNGTAWAIQSSPTPAGAVAQLSSVSCPSSNSCTAVGFQHPSGANSTTTLVEQWNGTTWTNASSPNRAVTSFDTLLGVSCAASTNCKAVGGAASDRYHFPLIEHYQ